MRMRSPMSRLVPRAGNESTSVWAQYTIRLKPGRRDALAAALKAQGIPTAIYYTKPLHRQPAYRDFPGRRRRRAGERALAEEVISLPMHAYLEPRGPGPHHRRGAAGARGLTANRSSFRGASQRVRPEVTGPMTAPRGARNP